MPQPDLFSWKPHSAELTASSENERQIGDQRISKRASYLKPSPELDSTSSQDEARAERDTGLLDVRAAAAMLGLSKSTLDKMRCYGSGPRFIRATCRAVRYDPRDLRAFIDARRQNAESI